jgi:hypothetical protein
VIIVCLVVGLKSVKSVFLSSKGCGFIKKA